MAEGDKQWTTRAGQKIQQVAGPGAGADLRELERTGPRRDRLSVERERAAEQERLRRELTRKARRQQATGALLGALTGRTARVLATAVAVALTVWQAAPHVTALIDRPLTAAQLADRRARLDLRAAKILSAPAPAPTVRGSARSFIVTYRLPRGAERFDGTRTARTCQITFTIDRTRSQRTLRVTRAGRLSCP